VGAALLLPQSLATVLDNWDKISSTLSESHRKRSRFNFRA
jgi:hypothetical protein